MNPSQHQPIHQWVAEDRPREKLREKGIKSLTNAELIAILLRSGTRTKSAVDLAKEMLSLSHQKLSTLSRFGMADLLQIKGIGEAKATTILAALELGRRRKDEDAEENPIIKSSQDAYRCIAPFIEDLNSEEFWVLLLNRKNALIRRVQISKGGISGTVVDNRLIFREAFQNYASSIILAHNHPSGNLKPSQADIRITDKIKQAGEFMDIKLLDHLIITSSNYYSFGDEGMI
jgi:DNA repair protein RadC